MYHHNDSFVDIKVTGFREFPPEKLANYFNLHVPELELTPSQICVQNTVTISCRERHVKLLQNIPFPQNVSLCFSPFYFIFLFSSYSFACCPRNYLHFSSLSELRCYLILGVERQSFQFTGIRFCYRDHKIVIRRVNHLDRCNAYKRV